MVVRIPDYNLQMSISTYVRTYVSTYVRTYARMVMDGDGGIEIDWGDDTAEEKALHFFFLQTLCRLSIPSGTQSFLSNSELFLCPKQFA